MATIDELKNKEVINEVPQDVSGVAPVPEVKSEVVNTPVIQDAPKFTQTTAPMGDETQIEANQRVANLSNPPVETPVVDPVVNTPTVPVVETPVVDKVETPTIKPVKSTQKDTPILSAQEIKSNELVNQANADAVKKEQTADYVTGFSKILSQGATREEIGSYLSKNTELFKENKTEIGVMYKASIKAKSNTDFVNTYSNQTNAQLNESVKNGAVVVGSEQYNLLNPEKRAAFEEYQKLESLKNNKANIVTGEVNSFNSILNEVNKIYSTNIKQEYIDLLNSPELKGLESTANNYASQITDLDDQIEYLREDMLKARPELAQSSILLNAAIRDSKSALVRERNGLVNSYNATISQIANKKSDIDTNLKLSQYEDSINKEAYKTALGLYESRRQEAREDLSAQNKAIYDAEKLVFEAKNKAIAEETQFNRDKELLEFKAKLADDGIKGKYVERDDGTYFLYDDETIAPKKVLDAVDIPGITSNTIFENGQAYTEIYDVNNQGVGFTSKNTSLGAKERELLNAPNGTRIPTRLNKEQLSPNNPGGKECGEYVNDIMASTVGQKIGSNWEDKLSYANESTGGVGSVAVWKINPNIEDKYGHTGIIIGETGNDEWVIKSSNVKGQGIVTTGKVPKSAISGYRGTGVIGKEKVLNNAQKTFLDGIEKITDLSSSENKKTLNTIGLSLNDALDYKSANITTIKKEDYLKALDLIDKLNSAGGGDGLSDAIGIYSWARNTSDTGDITFDPGTDAADFKAQYDALVDGLTLPNLDKMSGVLTDKDIELLKNASKGGLSLTMSETDFKKSLKDLQGALNRAISGKNIPLEQVIYRDKDGVDYSKETLRAEIQKEAELYQSSGGKEGTSPDIIKQWVIDNGIQLN